MRNQGNDSGGNAWYNNTVDLGGTQVSWATGIVAILAVVTIFGTGWLVNIFSGVMMSLVLTSVAAYMAWNNRHVSVPEAVSMVLVAIGFFTFFMWLALDYFPQRVLQNDMSGWNEVGTQIQSQMPTFDSDIQNALPSSSQPSLLTQPNYAFETVGGVPFSGDPEVSGGNYDGAIVTETPQPTAPITETAVTTETVAVESAVGNPPPTAQYVAPTATANPVIIYLRDLNLAVETRDITASKTAAQIVLQYDSQNQQAQNVLNSIANEESLIDMRNRLPVVQTMFIKKGERSTVYNALRGNKYIVIRRRSPSQEGAIMLACEETATIKQLDGWGHGNEYNVKFCALDQFGVDEVGDEFFVE